MAFIAAAVASGLHAAHEKGVIHRDLKPGNIFLCSSGRVRLLDFGMAKVKEGPLRTGVGMIVGTPQYMSPEQIRQEAVGPKAEIYGLGAVLYRMLTGKLPFPSESLHEIVKMHLNAPPPRPSELVRCSTRMDAIVLACMQKDPAARPGSMLELRELLRPIAEELGPRATVGIHGQDRGELVPRPETAEGLKAPAAPPPVPTMPAAEFSLTNVQSDPPGAQVFVDHVPRGVAPIDLTVALPFELKLELSGYKTVRKKITKPGPVRVKLWPASPSLPQAPAEEGATDEPASKLPPD